MSRSRSRQGPAGIFRAGHIFHGKRLIPVGPIAVLEPQGDGSADGVPVTDAGQRLYIVFFDFLASATSVAQLPATQFSLDKLEVNGHTRRQTADPGNQRLPVRLPCSD